MTRTPDQLSYTSPEESLTDLQNLIGLLASQKRGVPNFYAGFEYAVRILSARIESFGAQKLVIVNNSNIRIPKGRFDPRLEIENYALVPQYAKDTGFYWAFYSLLELPNRL